MTQANHRTSEYSIDPMFLERWSPRAFSGEEMSERDLLTILEAGHWAPSSSNAQPWRFLYARKGTEHWDKFLGLLVEFNQSWAKHAAALVVIVSSETMEQKGQQVPSHSHSFDAGCAWGYLALQALKMGYFAHGMVGFDIERSYVELSVPVGYRVEAAVAIGKQGEKSALPDFMQKNESPNTRKPLAEVVLEGGFWEK